MFYWRVDIWIQLRLRSVDGLFEEVGDVFARRLLYLTRCQLEANRLHERLKVDRGVLWLPGRQL